MSMRMFSALMALAMMLINCVMYYAKKDWGMFMVIVCITIAIYLMIRGEKGDRAW
jgi:hypothetical protein